jgi:hypothetical protein
MAAGGAPASEADEFDIPWDQQQLQASIRITAFVAGRLLNRVGFHAQQAWFRRPSHFKRARALASELGCVVRVLVPVAQRDQLQAEVAEPIDAIASRLVRDPEAEFYFGRTADLGSLSYPHGIREDLLQPVFRMLDGIRRAITTRISEQAQLALRLGELVDQGVCPPKVYLHLQESTWRAKGSGKMERSSQAAPDSPRSEGGSTPGSFEASRWPGDLAPLDDWLPQIRQLLSELGILDAFPLGFLAEVGDRVKKHQERRRLLEKLVFSAKSPLLFPVFTGALNEEFIEDLVESTIRGSRPQEFDPEKNQETVNKLIKIIKIQILDIVALLDESIRVRLATLALPATQDSEDPHRTTPTGGKPDHVKSAPRFSQWAIGIENSRVWHVFQKIGDDWRHKGRLGKPAEGKGRRGKPAEGLQENLLLAFAAGGGLLEREESIEIAKKTSKKREYKSLLALVRPEMSRLRFLIKESIEIPKDSKGKRSDPLPWEGSSKCWRAKIQIGYAVLDDDSGRGLRFKTHDQLTAEERLDADEYSNL